MSVCKSNLFLILTFIFVYTTTYILRGKRGLFGGWPILYLLVFYKSPHSPPLHRATYTCGQVLLFTLNTFVRRSLPHILFAIIGKYVKHLGTLNGHAPCMSILLSKSSHLHMSY